MHTYKKHNIDWVLVGALIPILGAGLITLHSFSEGGSAMYRQLIWVIIASGVFVLFSHLDFRFLKSSRILLWLFAFGNVLLLALFVFSTAVKGSTRWLDFGLFSLQPVDLMKIILILILAKYFSRRHIEIKHVKHILISGAYVAIPFLLVFLQPDFGSALVLLGIWFGLVFVSGISRKHLLARGESRHYCISRFVVICI
ncbi:MAG: FtsW/RodA/SpoVE family cell cycle protein [Candidatus Pacebacteria bacterium]|nr:FtsW/RodA/SpoVE family cell cycle protein [Candidatus Paceibacterota bacterium]